MQIQRAGREASCHVKGVYYQGVGYSKSRVYLHRKARVLLQGCLLLGRRVQRMRSQYRETSVYGEVVGYSERKAYSRKPGYFVKGVYGEAVGYVEKGAYTEKPAYVTVIRSGPKRRERSYQREQRQGCRHSTRSAGVERFRFEAFMKK